MNAFSKIDLKNLPKPEILAELSFDDILAEVKADFKKDYPQYADAVEFESDPICALMQAWAYREANYRKHVNAAVRSSMLAYANDAALDNLAALVPLERLEGERNDDFRERIQLAPEGFSVAGPAPAYVYFTKNVSPEILDVYIGEPAPGFIDVYIYQAEDITPARLTEIAAALELVRPLNDSVKVLAFSPAEFNIDAAITLAPGVEPSDALLASKAAGIAYVASRQLFGKRVYKNALLTAMQIDGIDNVTLDSPLEDILPGLNSVAKIGTFEISESANA